MREAMSRATLLRRAACFVLSGLLVLGMCPTVGFAEQIEATPEDVTTGEKPLEGAQGADSEVPGAASQGTGDEGPGVDDTDFVVKAQGASDKGSGASEEDLGVKAQGSDDENSSVVAQDDNITWTEWSTKTSLPDGPGNYRLTGDGDVIIETTWNVSTDIKLDLNGHSIKVNTNDVGVINISSPGTLEVFDTTGDNGQITHVTALNTQNPDNTTHRGVTVTSGTFILRGGKIAGNYTQSEPGSGVYVGGGATFQMRGGEISGNAAGKYAYGYGGGVYCDTNGTFEMSGGTISGNRCNGGGGVYYKGSDTSSSFTLSGGAITGNVGRDGCGIYAENSFKVSGNPVVSGNEYYWDYSKNNILLKEGKQIIIEGELTEGASMGIHYAESKPYTFTSGYQTKGNTDAPSTYFFSDDGNYQVFWSPNGNEACLSREHSVTIPSNDLGTVTASVNGTNVDSKAVVGDTVSLSATPNDGYALDAFTVTKSDDPNTTVEVTNNAFTMPDHDVTVTATFRERHLHGEIDFQPWTSTTSLPSEAGDWYLMDDVKLSGRWDVPEGTTNLCLNGKTITADGAFDAFMMSSVSGDTTRTLSIYDHDGNTGKLTHTEGKLGCGVWVSQGCVLNLHGGDITGNTVNETSFRTGGGVHVYGGTFNMDGGKISNNTAGDMGSSSATSGSGAGVYVEDYNGSGTFNMSGGTIEHNKAAYQGGGVYCTAGGVLNISGGTIQHNEAKSYGGGVYYYNHDTPAFTLSGGTISNNTSNSAGGIYAGGDFNVSGNPVVTGNTKGSSASNIVLNSNGAGKKINITDELTTGASMGVTCDKNKPYTFTSGYKTNGSTADPSTYFFSDNASYSVLWTADGAEARLATERAITVTNTTPDYGTVTVSVNGTSVGTAVVGDAVTLTATPANSDLYALDELKISYGTGDDATEKDVTATKSFDMPDHDVTVTATFRERHFHDGKEYFPWKSTDSLPDVMEGNSYYYLTDNVTLASTWVAPQLESHLCLNGHSITLSQSGDDPQPVVRVAQHENEIPSTLVLYDESANEGTITHANGKLGGGVQVDKGGTFVMKGGNISGNNMDTYSDDYGGGVFVNGGTFTMEGGTIEHNMGAYRGGGVAVTGGTFTMEGGTIQSNGDNGVQYGGGVYVREGTFNLNGGTITNNTSRIGGGVAVVSSNRVYMSGSPQVTGNRASSPERAMGDNLCLVWPKETGDRALIAIEGALGEDARVGISAILDNSSSDSLGLSRQYTDAVFTAGYKAAQSTDPWDHFTSDDPSREVLWTPDGREAQLATPRRIAVAPGITGGTVKVSKNKAAEGETVTVQATPDEGWELVSVTAEDANKNDVEVKDNKELVVPASDVVVSATFRKKPVTPTPGPSPTPGPTPAPPAELHVTYAAHVQGTGDLPAVRDGAVSGTIGESRRLEAMSATVSGGSIEYRVHLQGKGWGGWVSGGKRAGTTGESRRLEALQMRLTGAAADGHHVWYRVHSQTYGWLGWASDGEPAGTAGMSKRAEAYQVVVLQDGEKPDGYEATRPAYLSQAVANGHLQGTGWTGEVRAGTVGTTGESRRMEALTLAVPGQPFPGGIAYQVHEQGKGWTDEQADGALAGTTGESRRIEAVRIRLTGELGNHLSVWYRVHSQTFGWSGWARDGRPAGTTGLARRAEAVELRIQPRGAAAPGPTANALRTE